MFGMIIFRFFISLYPSRYVYLFVCYSHRAFVSIHQIYFGVLLLQLNSARSKHVSCIVKYWQCHLNNYISIVIFFVLRPRSWFSYRL